MTALCIGISIFGIVARIIYSIKAHRSSIDENYWIMAAEVYRKSGWSLPVKLTNKYLLDDERLGYPPIFGYFLSRFSQKFIQEYSHLISFFIDATIALILCVSTVVAFNLENSWAVVLAVFMAFPILVTYN